MLNGAWCCGGTNVMHGRLCHVYGTGTLTVPGRALTSRGDDDNSHMAVDTVLYFYLATPNPSSAVVTEPSRIQIHTFSLSATVAQPPTR
jgi:hypothetical protein